MQSFLDDSQRLHVIMPYTHAPECMQQRLWEAAAWQTLWSLWMLITHR